MSAQVYVNRFATLALCLTCPLIVAGACLAARASPRAASMLEGCRENLRILHPLPRVNEIALDVDDTPQAYYVEQAQGGLYVRQSILCEVLGLEVND